MNDINADKKITHYGNLAIITVVYNNYSTLDEFFSSLEKQSSQQFHVFVADVSTSYQDYQYPSNVTSFQSDNNGYAFGVNRGVEKALEKGYSQFAIVNNDIVFDNNFVRNSLISLSHNPESLIGGKIYYAPGYEYHKDRYSTSDRGKVIWYAGGIIDWNHVTTTHIGVDEVDTGQFDAKKPTDFITGCLILYTRETFEQVGEWDDSYFLYYEDTDLCVRAKQKRIQCIYDPSVVIWHKNAQSTDGSGSSIHTFYQERNRFKFGLKYAPWKTKLHLVKNRIVSQFGTNKQEANSL